MNVVRRIGVSSTSVFRRERSQISNATIIPASELFNSFQWQQRAQLLPKGETLLVLPEGNRDLQAVGDQIRRSSHRQGHSMSIAVFAGKRIGQSSTHSSSRLERSC